MRLRADFPALPLLVQQQELERALGQGENLEALLEQCAHLADPTPLVWLCGFPGILEGHAELLADHLVEWPETSLLKVLKTLGASPSVALEKLLLKALRRVPLERLAVLAILERNLKNHFPMAYEAYLQALEADWSTPRALALLPSRALHRVPVELRPQRLKLAQQAIEQLGRVPKAVSLSHAEELLSKRVYTQPGHFFFELLQNAEDTRATTFRVDFREDRLLVWHDGLPFDVRDLVGVTSIGQTTKQKQQIGFFGVGFKSVYEITERPQIYSDVFCFEIIDVSIPRALERPPEIPAEGTTLVLPLKTPSDQWAAIARQLDPCVLLTLRHLRTIDLGDDWVIRRQGDQVGEQRFLLDESEHHYQEGSREVGRPDRTCLLVALYLDGQGRPAPAPDNAPTIYSYLPTHQPSGLRFLIHGHFDVPVDRERINPESAWNAWLLRQIPPALARLAARADVLDILPLPGEPQGPLAFLPAALGEALADLPCLPGRRSPRQVRLASPDMVDLQPGPELWAPENTRHRQVAEQTLGCRPFEVTDLIELLEQQAYVGGRFEQLYSILGPEVEVHQERLSELAIVPDELGGLHRPREVYLSSPQLRQLYPDELLLASRLDCEPYASYLRRLGSRHLGAEDLVGDLEKGMELADPEIALEVLAQASPATQRRASRLPLFLTQSGQRMPLAQSRDDWQGAVRVVHQPLADFYGSRRPLLAHDYEAWNPVELDWQTLVTDLVAEKLSELPHHLLAQGYQQLPEAQLRQLIHLPLWPDRPLVGALRAAYEELPSLFPGVTFLPAELASLPHVKALTPDPVGVGMVIRALATAEAETSTSRLSNLDEALQFLYDHADAVSTGEANQLMAGRLPDDRGRLTRLDALHRVPESSLRALYRPPLYRRFVSDATTRLLSRLGLLERLPRAGVKELLEDVGEALLSREHAVEVLDYIAGQARQMSREQAQRWLNQSIFPDRPLGTNDLQRDARVWLVEEDAEPLLRQGDWPLLEPRLRPAALELMLAAGVKPAGVAEVLALFAGPVPEALLRAPALLELLAYLRTHKDRLGAASNLADLRIWPTPRGERISARQVVNLDDVEPYVHCPELELLPPAWEAFVALDPLVKPRPAVEFVGEQVALKALEGQPLARQPAFLSTLEKVLAVACLIGASGPTGAEGTPLTVDGKGHLRKLRLPYCEPLALDLLPDPRQASILDVPGLPPLLPEQILQTLAELTASQWLAEGARRGKFYAWLKAREGSIFGSAPARQILTQHPWWRTQQNRLLPAHELVLDDRLPDLGVDWRPHAEIDAELRQILRRQLGVGTPRPEDLLKSHLLPAYREATQKGKRERALALLDYLVETLPDASGLKAEEFPLEDRKGRFRPAYHVVWPEPELGLESIFPEWLLAESYSPAQTRFIRSLGLAQLPPLSELEAELRRPRRGETARALARLASWLYRERGLGFLEEVPGYREQSWLPDALGVRRRPQDLFIPGAEVEAIIGAHGSHYPDPALADLLGEPLMQALGLRGCTQVTAEEVLSHLKACSHSGQGVSFRVYQWLEKGLAEGRLRNLRPRLANLDWVCSDDGVWFNHHRVLGVHAFTYFGDRRGYWERGFLSCPLLCQLFDIPGEISPVAVRHFLEEIAAEAARQGDSALLRKEKALPRMLLACYALLASADPLDRKLPVILAQARPKNEKRLLSADHPALVTSDTPSLEKLFESVGTLYVATPGSLDQREEVEAFHANMGVRPLREAFVIGLDSQGLDRSGECAEGIARLRSALRGLLAVVPRLRRQRDRLSPKGWVDQTRLKPLAHSGGIRVIEGLKITYQLPGVGTARVQAPGAFNAKTGELLIDYELARRPDAPLTGLAQGLLPCLYQGAGEEQLVDILEILLPLSSREAMDAYLDARHFPAAQPVEITPSDRLSERLGEILDYEIDQRLAQSHPQLSRLEMWRQPGILADCNQPEEAVARLLAGIDEPSPALRQALVQLFTAPSLDRPAAPRAPLPSPRPDPEPRAVSPPVGTEGGGPVTVVRQQEPVEQGLITRLVNWITGSPSLQQASERLSTLLPVWANATNPYAPAQEISTQFWATRDKMEQISAQAPASGLHHQPHLLPRPYLYAVHMLSGDFRPETQRWLPVLPAQLAGFQEGQPTGRTITFQGTLAPGQSRLPIPLYSRLQGTLQVNGKARFGRGPLGEVWVDCHSRAYVAARFQAEILAPPRLTRAELTSLPPAWSQPTHPDLPDEVTAWVETVRHLSPWERALAAQEFVQVHYAYDPDYLDAPEATRTLNALPRGRGNHHLSLLHARSNKQFLGFGICYELNVMVCELVRRLHVPCLLASGWVLDEGWADRPDHLFALAVLASPQGPCLLPLDGANSTQGPLRPLGRRRPPGSALAVAAPVEAPPGVWSAPGTLRPAGGLEELRLDETRLLDLEVQWHIQAVGLVLAAQGRTASPELREAVQGQLAQDERLRRLSRALDLLLPTPEVSAALVRLMAGDYTSLTTLPPAVEQLVQLGLARVQTVPILQVTPLSRKDP